MKGYTKEDEEYFERLQLNSGIGPTWDERQDLHKYLEDKNAICDHCKGTGYDPHAHNDGITEPCPECREE